MAGDHRRKISSYDRLFDQSLTHQYNLSIRFNPDGLSFAVYSLPHRKYIAIETFIFPDTFQQSGGALATTVYLDQIAKTIDEKPWLLSSFNQRLLIYNTKTYTLVPEPLFDPAKKTGYLDFVHKCRAEDTILVSKLQAMDSRLVFGINKEVFNELNNWFEDAQIMHHAGAMLASTLNLEGRADEAAAQYRHILAEHPGSGLSWWGLAVLKPMPLTSDDVQAMRAALADADPDDFDRIAIHFALGHALEAQCDYAAALESLRQAHALAGKGHMPWDGKASAESLEQTLQAFAIPNPAQPQDLGREVIFIASLPRSGSTLVEQILASHSQVTGTAELPDMQQIIGDTSRQHDAPLWQWAPSLDADGWRALGEAYLQRTARWRSSTPRSTDKMPSNWRHVGAILSMLPNARVVVVRRDPLESALGCYRMLLDGHDYAHSFEGLAETSRQFDRTVHVWQSRYPERVRVQSYEDLTVDPDGEIRALLAFCDLPFEQSCIEFHSTRRRVSTPSAAQVRQPMRRDTARANRYGALLDPLREALGLTRFADSEGAGRVTD